MTILGIIFLSVSGLLLVCAAALSIICNHPYKHEDLKTGLWIGFAIMAIISFFGMIPEFKDKLIRNVDKEEIEFFIAKNKIIILVDDETYEFSEHKDYRDLSENELENIEFRLEKKINIYGFSMGSEELKYKIKE